MDEILTQVGVGGILAMLILKEVFGFLKSRDSDGLTNGDGCEDARAQLDRVGEQTKALVDSTTAMVTLVSATDPTGLPLIYRDSQAMNRLNTTLEALQRSIERLGDRVDRPGS